jgi:hypothetical protein
VIPRHARWPIRGPAAAGRVIPATPRPGTTAAPVRVAGARRIEIDTCLTDDPAAVDVDPKFGRITGATVYISSRITPDGAGSHVLTLSFGELTGSAASSELDCQAAVDLHARLVEICLTARRMGEGLVFGEMPDE